MFLFFVTNHNVLNLFHHRQMRVKLKTGTQDKQHMLSTDICKLLTTSVGS